MAYFNFDENEEYKQFFETTKDVDRILQNLILASGQKVVPGKTLIIFDEVQDCPKVINSMKYFCENSPQYHVACAGSLLGIALAKLSSFPVGKVDFIIQRENDIIPVEVKAEANTNAKSLKKYKEKFGDKVKLRVRFSLDNLKLDDDLLNIPLFMADYTVQLIGIALKKD